MKMISSKKIICLAFILVSLSSCQNLFKKTPQPDFKIQDEVNTQPEIQPYETINSEQDAIALNQQSQQKLQEVEVQDRIFFGYDAFDLNDESKKALDNQIAWLKSDEKIKIIKESINNLENQFDKDIWTAVWRLEQDMADIPITKNKSKEERKEGDWNMRKNHKPGLISA